MGLQPVECTCGKQEELRFSVHGRSLGLSIRHADAGCDSRLPRATRGEASPRHFLQHDVHIRPAESEVAHTSASRQLSDGFPRLRRVGNLQLGGGEVVGAGDMGVRHRHDGVPMEHQRGLDEGGSSRSAQRVADQRFHRGEECAELRSAFAGMRPGYMVAFCSPLHGLGTECGECIHFGGVADHGGRAVGLEDADREGGEAGIRVSPAQGQQLSRTARGHRAL